MTNILKNQLYVGRTSLSEDDVFKLFDFDYTDTKNDISLCMFSILMDLGWFDEDYMVVEFNRGKSLDYFLDHVKNALELDINSDVVQSYGNIDFIVSIDSYEGDAEEPKVKYFKNSLLEIKYLGTFASK